MHIYIESPKALEYFDHFPRSADLYIIDNPYILIGVPNNIDTQYDIGLGTCKLNAPSSIEIT